MKDDDDKSMDGLKATLGDAATARGRRQREGKSNFNADKTRYISREFLGWVCYQGRTVDGQFVGQRVGVTSSEADADGWLAGEPVRWDIPAGPSGSLVDQGGQ